jgi:hypothetical protein
MRVATTIPDGALRMATTHTAARRSNASATMPSRRPTTT